MTNDRCYSSVPSELFVVLFWSIFGEIARLTNNLDDSSAEALPDALREPLVVRAIEELTMVNQTELERARYEARRKAQLDHNTWLKAARLEGRQEGLKEGRHVGIEEGRTQGEWIGAIHVCQRLLNRPETATTSSRNDP
jgi:flagellar biosynthesis/type III secretory pathway protein FliH